MDAAAIILAIFAVIASIYVLAADPYGWQPCHEEAATYNDGWQYRRTNLSCGHGARFTTEQMDGKTLMRCVCPAPGSVTP